jgi:hypothetical protein
MIQLAVFMPASFTLHGGRLVTVELFVMGAKHDTHAAGANLLQDSVM